MIICCVWLFITSPCWVSLQVSKHSSCHVASFRRRYTIQSSLSSITKLRPTITFLSTASTSRVPRGNRFKLHLSSTNYIHHSFSIHKSIYNAMSTQHTNKNKNGKQLKANEKNLTHT